MSNYKITFSSLKDISEHIARGNKEYFVEFLNSFEGKDIYEKFKNIMMAWELDASYTLDMNINGKVTKIQLSYIRTQFSDFQGDSSFAKDGITITVGIPTNFEISDGIPIYNTIKKVDIGGYDIDLTELDYDSKKAIIDKLPATTFLAVMDGIREINDKIFSIDSELLKNFQLNFLSSDPLVFLESLFSNFDDLYFKDVIFHLSKRLGGDILMQSTPLEIDYYLEKMSSGEVL